MNSQQITFLLMWNYLSQTALTIWGVGDGAGYPLHFLNVSAKVSLLYVWEAF